MTATEAAWMKSTRRSLARLVTARKVRTQATNTLEKSRVRKNAPPFHTGENAAERKNIPIRSNRYKASLGKSRRPRFERPTLSSSPMIANTPEILASGTECNPGIQSSGRAQYTTKKTVSQKYAPFNGSDSWTESTDGAELSSAIA